MKKQTFYTPGPSELYFTVQDHLRSALREGIPSISHRSKQFQALFQETTESLRYLLGLETDFHMVFTSSATEIWERLIQNTVQNTSTHIYNGAFGKKFHDISLQLGKRTQNLASQPGERLLTDVAFDEDTELIALTHNETSVGYALTEDQLRSVALKRGNALLALDVVSSAPVYPIPYNLVDTFYFSVQKCFGLPAGLGVWFYNDKVLEKARILESKQITGSYHSLSSLHSMMKKNQTPETPNVLAIYLLNEVTKDLLRRDREVIWRETQYKGSLLNHTIDRISGWNHFISSSENRSLTTIVADVKNNEPILIKLLESGIVIGSGYGNFKKQHIRIANFPTHSKEQMELLVDTLEML